MEEISPFVIALSVGYASLWLAASLHIWRSPCYARKIWEWRRFSLCLCMFYGLSLCGYGFFCIVGAEHAGAMLLTGFHCGVIFAACSLTPARDNFGSAS